MSAHIKKDHQNDEERKRSAVLVARQQQIFVFMVRKTSRGHGLLTVVVSAT